MAVAQNTGLIQILFTQRWTKNESVLLHLNTKRYYSPQRNGSKIWQHLQAGIPPETISDALESEYEIADAKTMLQNFWRYCAGKDC
ncbi:MAG: PqqD family protein [Calditrichia bacterium]